MINRKIEPQHDEGTRSGGTNLSKGVPAWSKCPLGSAPPRLLCLPRARLAALGSSALPRVLELAASKVAEVTHCL